MTAPTELPVGSPADDVKRMVPWLVAVAFFMESLDTTILNTAVPTVAAALNIAPLSMKSVLSSYTLSLAVFIPLSGWVADRFGTRRVFSSAIGIFTLGSALCGLSTSIHMLTLCRILQGMGGAMMVPVGRLTMVRTFAKSELVRAMTFVAIPSLIGPMLGPLVGGVIVRFFHWRIIFLLNLPIGLVGLYLVYRHLPDYRSEAVERLDWVGLVLFGCGVALLSYVLEVFGEHTLSLYEISGLLLISVALLLAYARHAVTVPHPLLHLALLRIRTLRTAILGSFVTRIGVPQSVAAMSLRVLMPRLLRRFGYRTVLLCNTVAIGVIIASFSLVRPGTPPAMIVGLAFAFGFFSSFQYTSMNTLVYADVPDVQTSMASTMASTMQQLSMSFGVAAASLATAIFIPDRLRVHIGAANIVGGIHKACIAMGLLTICSTLLFRKLGRNDGANISRHKVALPAS
jgi:MFS family permease